MTRILASCLLAYVLLTALLIGAVPVGGAPDESAHLEYVRHLFQRAELPVFTPRGANYSGYEFHQPPLYYAVCAAVWKLLPQGVQPFSARVVSLTCGVLTLLLLWRSLRLLFSNDRVLALMATGFTALWPLHIAVGASAGNDAMAGLMCAGIFWSVARLAARAECTEYSTRDVVLLGLFCGLGMLTKSSVLPVALAGLGAAWHFDRRRSAWLATRTAILVLTVALALCGWWLARNTMLYGDPLAARIFDEAFKNSSPRPADVMAATGVSLFEYIRAFCIILFATCWGFFGGPNTALRALNPFGKGVAPEVLLLLPLMLICLVATVVSCWGVARWIEPARRRWQSDRVSWTPRVMSMFWWSAAFVLVALALLRFNLTHFQAQARYLHPALLPMALFFSLGWKNVIGERRTLWVASLVFGAVLLAITLWNLLIWKTLV